MSWDLLPRSSALYKFLKEKTPDWRHVIGLIESPIFRAVVFLPIVGYFILYTGLFQGFLAAHELETDWLLSLQQRLDLVYSGGVLLLIAYLLYRTACPPMIRESNSLELYIDRFRATGSLRDVLYVVEQAAREADIFGPNSRHTEKFALRTSQFIERVEQSVEVDMQLWKKKDVLLSGIQSRSALSKQTYATLNDFELALYDATIQLHDDPWLKEYGTDLQTLFYVENAQLPVLHRISALAFAWAGYALILLPALEAYIQISWR